MHQEMKEDADDTRLFRLRDIRSLRKIGQQAPRIWNLHKVSGASRRSWSRAKHTHRPLQADDLLPHHLAYFTVLQESLEALGDGGRTAAVALTSRLRE